MSLTPKLAAIRITRQLKTAEAQANQALLECSKLMTELVEARQATGIASHTGQDALIRLARAQTFMLDSSSDLFRTHDAVYKIGLEMGLLEEKAAGGAFEASEGSVPIAA
jgi:hypothetical protein